MSSDRNLLFGILAVQMNFVSRDALIVGMNAWVIDKQRPLADILVEQGALSAAHRALLDPLVDAHVAQHGGAEKSLAALSSVESVKQELAAAIPDRELQQTLVHLRPQSPSPTPVGDGSVHTVQHQVTPLQRTGPAARFRILRPHARGGLGEVFVAEDTELHREVALKEIQSRHADDQRSRGRFVLEAEITGGLEHPGIVPVYGLGAYADGRPFYAMRFIRGDSLKEAIERYYKTKFPSESERNLAFRNLLKRFVDVCNAIAYAHSRGILHRDLKPGNIMLGKYGETLVVDWGLGKPIGRAEVESDSDERTLTPASSSGVVETRAGTAIGTPAYMSPEQATGRLDQLGPESDVYSLGATLYALLTGKAPFAGELHEILRQVEKGDFLPPRQVRGDVPPALDAIVRKAMATRLADRYLTALALAADVEHWLADEPVSAYPEPLGARLRRWGRKHRTAVAGLAALLVTAVVGLVIGLYFVNAEKSRTERARKDEADQRVKAEQARDLARGRFKLALDAFNDMVFGIQTKLKNRLGTQELQKELLEKAHDGLQKLLQEAEAEGNPDQTLVWCHLRMGDVFRMLGDAVSANAHYLKSHALAQRLAEADSTDMEALRDLGTSLERLGIMCDRMGQWQDAYYYFRRMLAIKQRLAAIEPEVRLAQRELSVAWGHLGDVSLHWGQTKDALDYYQKSLQIGQRLAESDPKNAEAQHDLSASYLRLGDVSLQLGQTKDALDCYQKCLQIGQHLAEAAPTNAEVQRGLSVGYLRLGDVTLRLGQTKDALDFYQKSLQISQRLADADPKNAEAQRDPSVSYEKLGDVTLRLGLTKDALEFYQKSSQNLKRLAESDPMNAPAQRDLSVSFNKLGDVTLRLCQTKDALNIYQKSLQIAQRLAEADPTNAQAQRDLSVCYEKLGDTTRQLGQTMDALDFYQKCLQIVQRLIEANPTNAQAQRDLSVSFSKLGDVMRQLDQPNGALDFYQKSLEIDQRLAEADPQNAQARRALSVSYIKLGDVKLQLGQTQNALGFYQKGLQINQRLAESDPKNAQAQHDLCVSFCSIGLVHKQQLDFVEALSWFMKAEKHATGFSKPGSYPGDLLPWLRDQIAFCRLAEKVLARPEFAFEQKPGEVTLLVEARVGALLARKHLADAVATTERYAAWAEEQSQIVRNEHCYNAACFYARCAGAVEKDKDALAVKALALLKKAQAAGYFDAKRLAHLKQDKDLDPLREREDFKAFVKELEEKAKG